MHNDLNIKSKSWDYNTNFYSGELWIGGDINQSGDKNNLKFSSSHTSIFYRQKSHTVNYMNKDTFSFGNLYLMKESNLNSAIYKINASTYKRVKFKSNINTDPGDAYTVIESIPFDFETQAEKDYSDQVIACFGKIIEDVNENVFIGDTELNKYLSVDEIKKIARETNLWLAVVSSDYTIKYNYLELSTGKSGFSMKVKTKNDGIQEIIIYADTLTLNNGIARIDTVYYYFPESKLHIQGILGMSASASVTQYVIDAQNLLSETFKDEMISIFGATFPSFGGNLSVDNVYNLYSSVVSYAKEYNNISEGGDIESFISSLDSLLQESDKFISANICCPVDVYLYKDNLAVLQIKNNTLIQNNTDDVHVVIEQDKKHLYFPVDSQYDLKITGYDYGEMAYSLVQMSDTQKREIVFDTVPVNPYVNYSTIIDNNIYNTANEYALVSNSGVLLYPTDTIIATCNCKVVYPQNVTVTRDNSVITSGTQVSTGDVLTIGQMQK